MSCVRQVRKKSNLDQSHIKLAQVAFNFKTMEKDPYFSKFTHIKSMTLVNFLFGRLRYAALPWHCGAFDFCVPVHALILAH